MTSTLSPARAVTELREFQSGPHPVVSCYLRLTPADRVREQYLTGLRGAIDAAIAQLTAEGSDPDTLRAVKSDCSRIAELVNRPEQLPASPGAGIFACGAAGLLELVPMAMVHRTRVVAGRRPALGELIAAEQRFGRVLALVLDREHLRLFEVTGLGAEELPGARPVSTRGGRYHSDRHGAPGWGERDFHGRIEEERQRRFGLAEEMFRAALAAAPAGGIVLAGPRKETAALRQALPDDLADLVLGVAPINPTAATPAGVRDAALAVAAEAERQFERRLVAELAEAAGEDRAVNGAQAVLRALARGQVRTLLLRPGLELAGFRCGDDQRLVLFAEECLAEAAARPVADLSAAALELALDRGAGVVTIEDPEAAARVDGMAALLRYR